MIDWRAIEPLTPDELAALHDADQSDDPLVVTVMTVLARAHVSDLVYGGNASKIDPSGWTDSTLPAVAALIAARLAEMAPVLTPNERRAIDEILDRPYADPDDDAAVVARAAARLAGRVDEPR